jgi:hypothetical protein
MGTLGGKQESTESNGLGRATCFGIGPWSVQCQSVKCHGMPLPATVVTSRRLRSPTYKLMREAQQDKSNTSIRGTGYNYGTEARGRRPRASTMAHCPHGAPGTSSHAKAWSRFLCSCSCVARCCLALRSRDEVRPFRCLFWPWPASPNLHYPPDPRRSPICFRAPYNVPRVMHGSCLLLDLLLVPGGKEAG